MLLDTSPAMGHNPPIDSLMWMDMPETILIVDDEADVREVIRKYFEKEGFSVIEAVNGPQALHLMYEHQPDLVILDVMLPGLDGLTITRSLRDPVGPPQKDAKRIPIIILTARTDEQDRLVGFDLGADDYVTKPFSPRELVLRARAVLRRSQQDDPLPSPEQEAMIFGDLRLEPVSRLLKKREQEIPLTAKEFDLIWFLARNPRQVFTRAQLLHKVWGYDFYGDDSTVTVHIHRLREKIEDDPAKPVYLHTIWGVGYKFEA